MICMDKHIEGIARREKSYDNGRPCNDNDSMASNMHDI
jgi:hypothetical protein